MANFMALTLGVSLSNEFNSDLSDPSSHPVCDCPTPKIYFKVSGSTHTCFNTIDEAIQSMGGSSDAVVFLGSNVEVKEGITIKQKEVNLYGVDCSSTSSNAKGKINKKPKVTSFVTGIENSKGIVKKDNGLLKLFGSGSQTLRLRDIDFTSAQGKEIFGHAILAKEGEHITSLDIRNCRFTKFVSRNHGSVISLQTAYKIFMDEKTMFKDNKIEGYCDCYYGGTVSAMYVGEDSTLEIYANFYNNHVRYHYDWANGREEGSEHAEGGALYFAYVDGFIKINGNYH
eukprot:Awhi_evm1s452